MKMTGSSERMALLSSPLASAGVAGSIDRQAGDVGVPGLEPVRVGGRQAAGHARAAAEDDRHGELAAAHVAHVGGVVDDLVDRHAG